MRFRDKRPTDAPERRASSRRGFTLTEMMMAVVISVAVFGALGVLLTRCFSLWLEAQAQWKLAQHARVARLQILNGGFGIGTGLLSATNVTIDAYGSWERVQFNPVSDGQEYHIYGWPGTAAQNIWLKKQPTTEWAYAQTVSKYGYSATPSVLANNFDASITNQKIILSYTLNFQAMGRNYELPQVIEAHLVNE